MFPRSWIKIQFDKFDSFGANIPNFEQFQPCGILFAADVSKKWRLQDLKSICKGLFFPMKIATQQGHS